MKPIPKHISPIRYFGGKHKFLNFIHPKMPCHFDEYREPFLGGGSMALSMMWRNKNPRYWLNEGNPIVFNFWKQLHANPASVSNLAFDLAKKFEGKELHKYCQDNLSVSKPINRAAMFFILNHISFNGSTTGVYAGKERLTDKKIHKLLWTGSLLQSVELKITNYDYSVLVCNTGKNTVVYLDPPYELDGEFLYGDLHEQFDHKVFYKVVNESKNKWLISYGDAPSITKMFSNYHIDEIPVTYTAGNVAKKCNEILIRNF